MKPLTGQSKQLPLSTYRGSLQRMRNFQPALTLYSWGTFGTIPGGMWGPHQFSVDSENNLYISDVHVGRVQKYTPKPGVNPALLVGQRMGQ